MRSPLAAIALAAFIVAQIAPSTSSAQSPVAEVRGQDSAITVRGTPWHVLLHARNPTARAVALRVVSVEFLPASGAPVGMANVAVADASVSLRNAIATLPPGFDDQLTVTFRDATRAAPENADRFRYRIRYALNGRAGVTEVTVTRWERRPWRQ